METQTAVAETWDVIIVGTGVGGATLGHALSQDGLRVLFCEKGSSGIDLSNDLRGDYAENFFPSRNSSYAKHRQTLARAGRFWDEIEDYSHLLHHRFVPFIGAGAGGSSALYGMALERFFPGDVNPREHFPNHQGTNLPETWPISYADLLPYYEAAERLYRVHGTLDPIRSDPNPPQLLTPPPLSQGAAQLFRHFRSKGLHPYQLPLACEYVDGCECCQGYLCDKDCKNDSGRICLKPAIRDHGARLLDRCEVLGLEANRKCITGVSCRRDGEIFLLRAATVVLAAGALVTPTILLRSKSIDWPNGLANRSGLVGRNLMRHFVDLYLVSTGSQANENHFKSIAFNDYYRFGGQKLGTVQSFGQLPPVPVMMRSIRDEMKVPGIGQLAGLVMPLAKGYMEGLIGRRLAFASIVEDPPYYDNGVLVMNNGGVRINYRVAEQDIPRIERMRSLVQTVLAPYPTKLVGQANNNHRIAHACGTCRFGEDSVTSVLDRFNRAHDLENLYIVDSSFFPSSGGTNPSLTIAANALRVAEHMRQLK